MIPGFFPEQKGSSDIVSQKSTPSVRNPGGMQETPNFKDCH